MRLTTSLLAATALLLSVAPATLADSFQFTINSSVQESVGNTGNDNIMGIYSTPPDEWGTQSSVVTGVDYYMNSPFSNISFSVPAGNAITSASMELIFPRSPIQGTGNVFPSGGGRLPLHAPDPSNPVSIAPSMGSATTVISVAGMSPNGLGGFGYGEIDGNSIVFNLSNLLTVSGTELSTIDMEDIGLQVTGDIYGGIGPQGYNYASYIGATGQADIPYELEVVGTYSPVPEPSSIALLGTGLVGLAGFARRKFVS